MVALLRLAAAAEAPTIEPLRAPSGLSFPYPASPADAIQVMYNHFNPNSLNFEVLEADAVLFVMALLSADTYLYDILQENIARLQLDMYPVRVARVKGPSDILTMQFCVFTLLEILILLNKGWDAEKATIALKTRKNAFQVTFTCKFPDLFLGITPISARAVTSAVAISSSLVNLVYSTILDTSDRYWPYRSHLCLFARDYQLSTFLLCRSFMSAPTTLAHLMQEILEEAKIFQNVEKEYMAIAEEVKPYCVALKLFAPRLSEYKHIAYAAKMDAVHRGSQTLAALKTALPDKASRVDALVKRPFRAQVGATLDYASINAVWKLSKEQVVAAAKPPPVVESDFYDL